MLRCYCFPLSFGIVFFPVVICNSLEMIILKRLLMLYGWVRCPNSNEISHLMTMNEWYIHSVIYFTRWIYWSLSLSLTRLGWDGWPFFRGLHWVRLAFFSFGLVCSKSAKLRPSILHPPTKPFLLHLRNCEENAADGVNGKYQCK